MNSPDLVSLDDSALKALIRGRVLHEPCCSPENDWRYGSVTAERRAALRPFFPEVPTPAAVLVPIVERHTGLTVLLTRRSTELTHHAGQISFPGGRVDLNDVDVVSAALRETEEEIGLARSHIELAGFLPDHLIISGYRVTPVVGFVRPEFQLRLEPTEVAGVFEMPLRHLLDERNHVRRVRHFAGNDIELTDLPFGEHNIWGATAGMLITLYRVLTARDA
jgi:8-oxo-dGTP pyrophosphatase MutT (NUDIX family)